MREVHVRTTRRTHLLPRGDMHFQFTVPSKPPGAQRRCTISTMEQEGATANAMLAMGFPPVAGALEALTDPPDDASAIIDYFAPLKGWLDDNKGKRRLVTILTVLTSEAVSRW